MSDQAGPEMPPPEAIEIRDARRAEVPAIVALLADDPLGARRERLQSPLPEVYLRAFDAIERDPNNRLLVAVLNDQVVGCLQLTFIPGLSHAGMTRAQVEAVRVAAALRGKRVGERLLAAAIEAARDAGAGLVQLSSDKSRIEAHRFYERLGFVGSHLGMKLPLQR